MEGYMQTMNELHLQGMHIKNAIKFSKWSELISNKQTSPHFSMYSRKIL